MDFDELVLVAVLDDLSDSPKVDSIADAVEYRMDRAESPIEQIEQYTGSLPIIATFRSALNKDRLDLLASVSRYDVIEAIDVEIESIREESTYLNSLRSNDVDIIVSYYNYEETPDANTLNAIVDEAVEYGDVVKIAVLAETPKDTLVLLSTVNEATEAGKMIAGVSMGSVGRHTRVLAPMYGSKLAYAPLEAHPLNDTLGQISLKELAELIEETEKPSTPVSLDESIQNPLVLGIESDEEVE